MYRPILSPIWDCPNDPRSECPYDFYHKVLCGGGCRTWFKNEPNEIRSHWIACNETVPGTWENLWNTNCPGYYYSCNGDTSDDCWNASHHGSGTENPIVSPTPTPTPTDDTPNCPDCTSHCSSPCSCMNSGTCNGTVIDDTPNCQDCTSHCSSPCSCMNSGTCNGAVSSPPTGSTPPPSTPSPPSPPTTVSCGASSWTGCSASVSSRTEHKVDSCSNCGLTYWTCNSSAAPRHETSHTCTRSGCGASYTRCTKNDGSCSGGSYVWHQ